MKFEDKIELFIAVKGLQVDTKFVVDDSGMKYKSAKAHATKPVYFYSSGEDINSSLTAFKFNMSYLTLRTFTSERQRQPLDMNFIISTFSMQT